MSDEFGDRMKLYEAAESARKLMPLLPVIARLDGKTFHNFTRGMNRPFDKEFSSAMTTTTIALVKETGATMGYTQSDEITLAWHSLEFKSQIWFDGRVQKMCSVLASTATLEFLLAIMETMHPRYVKRKPKFDCRVFNVPNRTEGANQFLWRESDATKNSITMAASALYSHKELHGKNGSDKQEMLFQRGVNWNDYPASFKRGTYVQRRMEARSFSVDELEKLPKKHEAHSNPNLIVQRTTVGVIDIPIFSSVTNREDVIFCGALPVVAEPVKL